MSYRNFSNGSPLPVTAILPLEIILPKSSVFAISSTKSVFLTVRDAVGITAGYGADCADAEIYLSAAWAADADCVVVCLGIYSPAYVCVNCILACTSNRSAGYAERCDLVSTQKPNDVT